MAKIKKKGTSGQAKNFITRTQAVRKLQITLPDFRRLCIFKGIYPREPRNIKKASKSASHSTTFYYTKDIQYLLHEPLLAKFREQKALQKKIARSLGRNEVADAVRLEKHGMPKITLDNIVRERYPTFIDALRDLDDALSLLFLFANLPSTSTVPAKVIARCQRLCHEFEHYLISTYSLRKSFLSIKGIYYQAAIQGQDIMWLVPYRFVQNVTGDVDYRIMGTFVDFYTTLLGFVNFRLYTSIGLVYPPKFDTKKDDEGAELGAFTLEGRQVGAPIEGSSSVPATANGHDQISNTEEVQAHLNSLVQDNKPHQASDQPVEEDGEDATADAIDKFEPSAPNGDYLPQPELSSNEAAALFSNLTFFISREAPRHPIEFLLRAFGCKRVAWDTVLGEGAFTHDESDPRITHQVVDRPPLAEVTIPSESGSEASADRNGVSTIRPGMYVPGRTYVQPQWVWDCVNEGQLLPPHLYSPGATLPPHLSPWMKPTKGQYDPTSSLAEQEPEGEAGLLDEAVEGGETDDEQKVDGEEGAFENDGAINGDMDVAQNDESEEEDASNSHVSAADNFAGFDEDEIDELNTENEAGMERAAHQQDLEAEAAGLPFSTPRNKKGGTKGEAMLKKRQREKKEQQELERQKMMMSRKKRKLFEKMQYSNNKKDAEAERLRSKRRKIEKGNSLTS